MNGQYEKHNYPDRRFPIIFHTDVLHADHNFALQIEDLRVLDEVEPHWHEGIELLCFLRGKAEIRINDEVIVANAGQTVLINSSRLHRITALENNCLYHCLILNCEFCRQWGFDLENAVFSNIFPSAPYIGLIDMISKESSEKRDHYKAMITAHCMQLLTRLFRERLSQNDQSDQTALKKTELVQQVLRYIRQNYENDVTLDGISDDLGYSKFYISHVFTEYTGMTVMNYLQQVRIHTAQSLLVNTNLSVSEISERCGYKNVSAFSAAFSRMCGQSPVAYRKSLQSI